jgi:hypothetical protein
MQLTRAAEIGSRAIRVEMIMNHAKSRDPYDRYPALSEDRFHISRIHSLSRIRKALGVG